MCRWPEFWTRLASTSKGIGARRERVNADQLLGVTIPHAPIEAQRSDVERLQILSSSVDQLRPLLNRACAVSDAYAQSLCSRPDLPAAEKARLGWQRLVLGDAMRASSNQVHVEADVTYRIAGIYSFGKGLIDRGPLAGRDTSYRTFTRLAAGDIAVSKLNGWEGAVAVVPPAFDGFCVSTEYPVFELDQSVILPEYFDGVARSPSFWAELDRKARGSMIRRRRINPAEFLGAEIWVPPIEDQRHVAAQLAAVAELPEHRSRAMELVHALVPAALNAAFSNLN